MTDAVPLALISEGLFDKAYVILNDEKNDVFSLIECCINTKKFSEAKNLFNNIIREILDRNSQKRYDFVEVLVLHTEEKYQYAIEKANLILELWDYSLRERVVLTIEKSFCLRKLGRFDLAINSLQLIKNDVQKLSFYYKAQFYNSLGLVYWAKGDLIVSLDMFKASLLNFESCQNKSGIARSYNNQANVFNDLGDLDNALERYQISIKIHLELGNDFDLGIVYNNIAVIFQKKGFLTYSIKYYQNALELMKKVGNLTYQAILNSNLGSLECDRGNLTESLIYLEEAKKVFFETNQLKHLAMTLSQIAEVYFERGDFTKGLSFVLESLTIKKDLKNILDILISIYTLYWYTFSMNKEFTDEILNLQNLVSDINVKSKNIETYEKLIKSIIEMNYKHFDKAKLILIEIKSQEGVEFNHKIMALKSLAIVELELWKNDVSKENFNDFNILLTEIIELCEKNNLVSSNCEIIAIQANFENSILLFDKSLETLKTGLQLAKNFELSKHIRYFEEKIKLQFEKLNDIDDFQKSFSKIDIDELKNYILTVNQIIKHFDP